MVEGEAGPGPRPDSDPGSNSVTLGMSLVLQLQRKGVLPILTTVYAGDISLPSGFQSPGQHSSVGGLRDSCRGYANRQVLFE